MKTEIELAKQAGWEYADDDRGFEPLWRFAELVRADERARMATDKSKDKALKLALEALEWINRINAMDYEYQQKARESLNAIYEELAEQPAQEPATKDVVIANMGNPFTVKMHKGWTFEFTSPPAQPATEDSSAVQFVPDAIHHTDTSETLEYIQGWNDCRAEMLRSKT